MARPLRLEFAGALYHLTARGNAQQPIFLDDTDRQQFIRLLSREIRQQHWRCYVYCLMGNHYHLVTETPEPNLSRGLKRLHGTYTQWFNRRHQRVGHLLQGRLKGLLVEKESYLQELCRYVTLNPVRAGIQEAPEWLDTSSVLSLFDTNQATARAAYQRFVADGVHQPSPWAQVTSQIFLGSPEFLDRIERLVQGKPLANVPTVQTQPTRLSPDEVLQRVAPRIDSTWTPSSLDHIVRHSTQPCTYCGAPRMNRCRRWPFDFGSPPPACRKSRRHSKPYPSHLSKRAPL